MFTVILANIGAKNKVKYEGLYFLTGCLDFILIVFGALALGAK